MDRSSTYDDDIYAWSMEQAALLRDLARTAPGLPPELDLVHLADEVEDVGKTELRSAESFARLTLLHLLKIASAENARPVDHWRAEVDGFRLELRGAMSRSIAQKVNLEAVWRVARSQAKAQLELRDNSILPGLTSSCPLTLDDLLAEPVEIESLTAKIRTSTT